MGMERIQAYNAGFYICLVITILGVILAILFFFTLHIKDAWKMSSGRTRNESIRNIKKETNQEKCASGEKSQVQNIGWKQTEVLNRAGEQQGSIPIRDGTLVLNPYMQNSKSSGEKIYFSITKNIMVIHTEEKI